MNDIRSRLIACFATVFPDLPEAEIASASMTSVERWDSLAMANLVTVLEEEFGIQIRPQDVEQLVSFPQVLQYLQSKA
jgi:acyl carrier protein